MIVFDENTHPAAVVFILLLAGIGVGMCTQAIIVALQAHTPKGQRAVVLSCRNFFRYLGSACGVVASSAVLQRSLSEQLPPHLKYLSASTYALPPLDDDSRGPFLLSYRKAIRNVFMANAAIMLFTTLACFFWKDHGLGDRPEDEEDIIERPPTQELNSTPAYEDRLSSISTRNKVEPDSEAGTRRAR